METRLHELAQSGELSGLPGEGAPLPDDSGPNDGTWAARHIVQNAGVTPEWVELRTDIAARTSLLRRRLHAHREWLRAHARSLANLPAERILDASRAASDRDARVRIEITRQLGELNALIRRYDLIVTPSLQLPLVTFERLEADPG